MTWGANMDTVEKILSRCSLAIDAGETTIEEGAKEALSCISDLFNGKPHFYDLNKVKSAVVAKVNAMNSGK